MRRSLLAVGVLGLAACGFDGAEGAQDAPIEEKCAPGFLDLCNQEPSAGVFSIPVGTARTLDTDSMSSCAVVTQGDGTEVCLLYFERVLLEGDLLVSGSRPFALVASQDLQLSGSVDASSRRGRRPGAGSLTSATSPSCVFRGAPGAFKDGGGGGAGGTFLTLGGNGGSGNLNMSGGAIAPTAGGLAPMVPIELPSTLRGGCAGQAGGDGNLANTGLGGPGGAAGGAIYLSGLSIAISGRVIASGAGGSGGTLTRAGGGGGGSGGMIVLQSPRVAVSGLLLATGGGGGEGADPNPGEAGADPVSISPAVGGSRRPAGGDGGNGTGISSSAGNGASANDGGGGGGGGTGVILLLTPAPTINGQLAPAATVRTR